MTSAIADVIGLIGSVVFIAAFVYANMADNFNKLWFNAANLLGAVLLMISLWVNFNLAAFVLEIAWAFIALAGLIAAVRLRLRDRQP